MAATRRLAAILAADVAGYSRPMGADEEGTLERLKAHRRQLIDPKINQRRGRIVKTTGDGMLVEFASVVDGVQCAAEVQRGMLDRDADQPDDRRIRLRVGINLGDIIAEGDDIFGDGVNVAARLKALAEPGGICISRVVDDRIRDKLPYPFEDLGEQTPDQATEPLFLAIRETLPKTTDYHALSDAGVRQHPNWSIRGRRRVRILEQFPAESTHWARITPTPTRPHRGGGSTNRSAGKGPPP